MTFFFSALLNAYRIERPQVVVGTSPHLLSAASGALIAKMFRVPFVFDVRDLWPEAIAESAVTLPKWLFRLIRTLASQLYRAAAHVVVTSDEQKRTVEQYGVPSDRVTVVSNGADLTLFRPISSEHSNVAYWRNKLGKPEFTVGYVGNLAFYYDFDLLFEVARRLESLNSFRFVICGSGLKEIEIRERLDREKPKNMTFFPSIPHQEMPFLLNAIDLHVIPHRKLEITRSMRAAKIFEALACGRAVLFAGEGETARIVNESQGGLVISAGETDRATETLEELRRNPAKFRAMGESGRTYVLRHFDREELADRYLKILLELFPHCREAFKSA